MSVTIEVDEKLLKSFMEVRNMKNKNEITYIAGRNLYSITYTMNDGKEYGKLVIADNASEIESFFSDIKVIEILEKDISMTIFPEKTNQSE